MRASIIIPLFDQHGMTGACLEALKANTPDHELVLVDNGSKDLTRQMDVTIRNPRNKGFAIACNQGARAATGDVLVFLNNDTEVQPGWLEPLLAAMPGIAGPKLIYPDGSIQSAGISVDFSRAPGVEAVNIQNDIGAGPVDAVTGACLAIDRARFDALGGFDSGFWNGYEDVDLCLKNGGATFVPQSVVVHHESQSDRTQRFKAVGENVARLRARWSDAA